MKDDKRNNYSQHEFMMKLVVGNGIESVEEAVHRLFFALGFKSKLLGTTYLKEAIRLWFGFPATKRVVLTADIYPRIAKKLDSTPDRVERAIRNAIIDCYDKGKLIWYNDLVRSEIVCPPYKPTNGEFISSVVSWLRIQCRQHARQMTFLEYVEI
ncbi:MAG: sporulation initiation factor Spo0A C-terminal domain-containing protein [Clostridiales bacterium]|nr:sporulation initiation factor Spo0A C-terminal domain-containing protein [Clostridiales bacterium]